jgi:hypothetical protein
MLCALLIAERMAAPSSALLCNTSTVCKRRYLKYSQGILGKTCRTMLEYSKRQKEKLLKKVEKLILNTGHGISLMRLIHEDNG